MATPPKERAAAEGRRARRPAPALRQRIFIPDRLRVQLDQGLDAGLLRLQAHAGCGKTAVVLQFLLDRGLDPHWYTCTLDDADAGALLAGLVRASGRAETTGGQTTLAAIASTDVPKSYRTALKPLMEELEHTDPDPSNVLVIDDADAVIDSAAAAQVLDYVLSAFAPYLRVILISRAELPLPSQAKRLLEGRAARVVTDDLLLRADEVAECARDAYDAELSAEEASEIFRATGGWGIALRLALSLRGMSTPLRPGQRELFTPEARADLFAYLASEVLRSVDERVVSFLRRTAVLDTLDPEICARLTGEERSAEMIQSLAGVGLPVMKAGWSDYRCHALLREYLLHQLSEGQLRDAHSDAGRAFAEGADWPQALHHFIAADDTDAALSLADDHGRNLYFAGYGRAVLDLVKSAPAELLEKHYRAEYWAAFAASRMFELDWAAAALERVNTVAVAHGDSATAFDAMRTLAFTLNGWGRYAAAQEVSQRLLDTVPEWDVARRAAVMLGYLTTGMGATNEFRKAVDLTRRFLPDLLVEPRVDASSEAYARAVSAVTLALEGDFAAARAELNKAELLISSVPYDVATTFIPWSRTLVEFQAGNPDAADAAARTAEETSLRFGDLQRVLECRAILASTNVLRGKLEEADRGFARLDDLRGGGTDLWGTMFTLLSRPQRSRMHGDLPAALAAAEANHALAVATSSAWFVCSTGMDVANFRLLNGAVDAAREPARAALAHAQELSADLLLFGAHMMVAATGADDEPESMAAALRIAEAHDYRFLMPYGVRLPQLDAMLWRSLGTDLGARAAVLLESAGPAVCAALRPLLPELSEAAAVRAAGVLAAFGPDGRDALNRLAMTSNRRVVAAARDALAKLDAANPHGLSRREVEVLQLLAQGLRTKEIAEQLVLTPATVSTHIQRIMGKTRTSSRAELVALAVRESPSLK